MITKGRARLTRWWRWIPSVALLGLVAMFADALPWGVLMTSLRGASLPAVLLAVLSTYLAVAARTLLFWRLLRDAGAGSIGLAARATVTAIALNSVLVGQAGEAGRVLLVARGSHLRTTQVLAMVVFEHAIISTLYLLLIISAGVLLPVPEALARWRLPALIALMALGGVLILVANVRGTGRAGKLGGSSGPLRRLRFASDAFLATLRRLASGPQLTGALTLAAIHWGLQLAAFHATTTALGYAIPPAATVIAFLAVTASSSVRITPGNVGVTQAVFAGAAGVYGVPMEEAVTIALLWQVVQTVPIVFAALAFAPGSWAMLRSPARAPSGSQLTGARESPASPASVASASSVYTATAES